MTIAFYFVSEYAIRRVQVNQGCFKLNGTYLLLAYVNDVIKILFREKFIAE